jgi:MFS transporter, DHA2 family, multidrug resistance protein
VLLAAFIVWEHHRESPLLDLSVFRNARFSAASATETVAFLALFGFISLVTQYFQFVRGYSTLSAGLHTLPFAVAGALAASIAPRLVNRVGTAKVVAGGLALMASGFLVAATISASSSYWLHVVPSMVLIASGLGLTTAPATEAINLATSSPGIQASGPKRRGVHQPAHHLCNSSVRMRRSAQAAAG